MPTLYEQLIDATIRHLQELKDQGTRFVTLAPGTLDAFCRAAAQTAPTPAISQTSPSAQTKPSAAHATEAPAPTVSAPEPMLLPAFQTANPPPATDSTSTISLSPQAKAEAMKELNQRALACVKCSHLASSRKNVVFGVGDIYAVLMFVGEAPGADEDEQGEPFVGAAGQLLTRIIQAMGLTRETVYIANILKCRPNTPGQMSGNRKPTADEMKTCISYLHSQIDLIQPKVLVALGATAVEGLLNKTGITRLRGQWQTYRGIPLMPTFHPSYLLRNQALTEKRKVWEDMLRVMEKLGMSISDKQRSYFLRA